MSTATLNPIDRRTAMKAAAMAAATDLAQSYASRARAAVNAPPLPDDPEVADVTWDKAPCRFCGTGCHVQVGVQDGKVVAIAGDQQAEGDVRRPARSASRRP